MKIAIVAPHTRPVPSYEGWGGTQRGIYDLSTGLAKRGHRVFVIAPSGSKISHENIHVFSPKKEVGRKEFDRFSIEILKNRIRLKNIDIVNIRNQNYRILKYLRFKNIPVVVSYHHKVSDLPELLRSERFTITVHSQKMHDHLEGYRHIKVVPYGIKTDHIPYFTHEIRTQAASLQKVNEIKKKHQKYALSLGRIDTRKATSNAIKVAKQANIAMIGKR